MHEQHESKYKHIIKKSQFYFAIIFLTLDDDIAFGEKFFIILYDIRCQKFWVHFLTNAKVEKRLTLGIDQSEEQNDRKYNHFIRIIVFDIEIHAYVTVVTN